AVIHPDAIRHWGKNIGFFGCFECIDDQQAANMLLSAGAEWLKSHQMAIMRGPDNLESQDLGFILSGFDVSPVILSSWNYPYYNRLAENFGLQKAKDLYVYSIDIEQGYVFPERFLNLTEKIARRYKVTIRMFDMKHILDEARLIIQLFNKALMDNWDCYPIDEAEAEPLVKALKPIVDPRLIYFAYAGSEPIGVALTLPDINRLLVGLNGRLFPVGAFRLLTGLKKLRYYRMWALGVVPEYHHKGIDVLLYKKLYDELYHKKVRLEANHILEDNYLMNAALKKMNFEMNKVYRVYEMPLE
ncbi:N-acetyltransferase, partial [candidate division KSB1 bacterium]|nr:N-acetyltransferase [candidate division KSB1 bacterium]